MKVHNVDSVGQTDNRIDTILGDGLMLSGEVNFSGGLQVDGNVKGTLKVRESGEAGILIVGKTGHIEGNIDVPDIVINGTVKGNVCSSKSINLGSTAVVDGDITYQSLEIVPGAIVNGRLLRDDKALGTVVSDISSASSRQAP